MIQLNLLPDIKLEYIKAQRARRMVLSISALVSIISLALLLSLFSIGRLQKKHIDDLSKDIASSSAKLKSQPEIDRILTVQNQLDSLTALHAGKPASSRLFGYLNDVTPAKVSITSFTTDFTTQATTITGTADALSSVNTYVDTLKFTKYTSDTNTTPTNAFTGVVLGSFGLASAGDGGQPASFTITLAYDKAIFDIAQKTKLAVPNQVTTRSQISQPTDLFKAAPATGATSKGSN
ncbi:MAG: hypothetical protein JWO35_865 [Candidatus Saccharibacteria bacterium]|nr:hypothetical protein [Candidatus Saccharibacteria bacterium]